MKEIMNLDTNLLTTNVPHHIDPSQLIYTANQLTGFYIDEELWSLMG